MDNSYEEFFYSENPQEIEKEKKKRNALHSLLPNLMGAKQTKQITCFGTANPKRRQNILKMPTINTKNSIFLENEQKGLIFGNWKESTKQSINTLNSYNNRNKQRIATPNIQRLFKTGDIDFANSYSAAFNNRYKKFFDDIFDNNGDLILDRFLNGIDSLLDEFQDSYAPSGSYQGKAVEKYNYNWIKLLNIFGIQYK